MWRKSIASVFLLLFFTNAFACTTFLLSKNGQLVFGRNYDWVTGTGMVHINSRNLPKYSASDKGLQWTSKYGSITFNQYGKEFPNGGMNEKGLVVELMWLNETQYPQKDSRPAIGVLQWIQYQLDNCQTVDEVLATDAKLRISDEHAVPLHYLVADAKGNAATIEFLNGKTVVHKGSSLPFSVLTNSTYSESVSRISPSIKKNEALPFADNSLERFATACKMVTEFQSVPEKVSAVDYAFSILSSVGQGDFTKWSIAYDISNKEIHFKTNKHNQRKLVRLAAFNFDCSQSLLSWNMNQPGQSDVSAKFQKSSYKENEELIRRSVLETGSRLRVSEADIEQTAQLYRFSECLKADGTVSKSQLGNIDFLAKNILWILAIGLVALLLKPLILTRNKA